MEQLYPFSLEVIQWLQNNYAQLAGFFALITFLGNEEFFLVALPLIYWCINKQLGRELGFLFFICVNVNTILKQTLREPRPFWLDPSLNQAETGGYGIPSGHTQYATVLYLYIAAWVGKGWVWLLAILLVILMGLSRIYLGQHFIHDVVAGIVVGLLILLAAFLWKRYAAERFSKRILGQRMLAALLVPLFFSAVFVGVKLLLGPPDLSVAWAEIIPVAEAAGLNEMTTAVSTLLGFGIGIILESSRVRFRSDGSLGQRTARYLVGIIVMVALWYGLGAVFPREPLWLALPLRFIRYGLIGLWGAYYAPMVFVRLGLAEADPDPGINLRI